MRLPLFLPIAAAAFAPLLLAAQQQEGVVAQWDARQMFSSLNEEVGRLEPLIQQVDTGEWSAKAASGAYGRQRESLRNEIGYLARTIDELSAEPDRVSKALEAFLRLQAVESMTSSFADGVRRYQNPAVADLLEGIANDISPYSQQFRDYLLELVTSKEAEWKIADEEAQRCRSQIIGKPLSADTGQGGR